MKKKRLRVPRSYNVDEVEFRSCDFEEWPLPWGRGPRLRFLEPELSIMRKGFLRSPPIPDYINIGDDPIALKDGQEASLGFYSIRSRNLHKFGMDY